MNPDPSISSSPAPGGSTSTAVPPSTEWPCGHANPEERILSVAYGLFSRRGIRDVGVNELIERSGVAKATFYRHFPSKDSLVLAFLEQRDKHWTVDAVISKARSRGDTPVEQLLAIFDVFSDWFRQDGFEGSAFINVLLEMGPSHPLGKASIDYLAKMRGHVEALATEAGLVCAEEFARSWHILMKGSIISATEGDLQAAQRAKEMARWLIEHHRP
ncbi:TetR/AcrR family transcriptional regulator [Arthrobacter sp. FW306-07-I]|uniref:TetR/AcrR family transcriptional regulator n=1 Tax=Arthrobacter sp. FW306-07-I TaxID=2879622 RepID=UPI001F310DCB|nr:TetR/AcrR family transcriptional regulator [Arthrobacter sp. FW306-07-I]UKA77585.1 TetR/AcrR family transcriptional regulator [Arthrobacter sp. FW306-07-I]